MNTSVSRRLGRKVDARFTAECHMSYALVNMPCIQPHQKYVNANVTRVTQARDAFAEPKKTTFYIKK